MSVTRELKPTLRLADAVESSCVQVGEILALLITQTECAASYLDSSTPGTRLRSSRSTHGWAKPIATCSSR